MEGNFTCFFYGTLMFPQMLKRVLDSGRENSSVNVERGIPAVLKGYKRRKVIGAIYPAILKGNAEDETSGVLLKGLSSQDITRLDRYEGDQYKRQEVKVHVENEENPIEAITYIWDSYPSSLHKEDWDPEDFRKQLNKWIANPDLV